MTAYLLKSALLLAVFYAFFLLFMRKTTFFRFNRMALLAGPRYACCCLFSESAVCFRRCPGCCRP